MRCSMKGLGTDHVITDDDRVVLSVVDADNRKDHYSAVAYAPAAEMITSWVLQDVVDGLGPDEYYPEVLEIPEYLLFFRSTTSLL